jgi:hypothetical protein
VQIGSFIIQGLDLIGNSGALDSKSTGISHMKVKIVLAVMKKRHSISLPTKATKILESMLCLQPVLELGLKRRP